MMEVAVVRSSLCSVRRRMTMDTARSGTEPVYPRGCIAEAVRDAAARKTPAEAWPR